MSERDKLIAKPDGLEILDDLLETCEMNGMHAEPSYIAAKMMHKELRALAAQQPEAVEPVEEPVAWLITWEKSGRQIASLDPCHEDDGSCVPLYTHPQVSAPADAGTHTTRGMQGQTGPVATPYVPTDHTAADATVREEGSGLKTAASAVGVTQDLDALVAEAWLVKQSGTRDKLLSAAEFTQLSMDYGECVALVRKTDATKAITDLRAEVERAKTQRDEAWKAFTRLRRAYSMVRYPTLTEELRLLYDAADAVAAGKGEEKS